MSSGVSSRPLLQLGKYAVLGHIAAGGMSAIYRATDEETGQVVALKVLPPQFAEDPVRLKRFAREARSAQRLQHENIVRVYDFGFASDTYFIVMEFVAGRDGHAEVVARGRLPALEVVDVLLQACRALNHAFLQGIVHRDIKPSNLLFTEVQGRRVIKLTDFGLALDWTNVDDARLTRQGTTMGTVDFMAPEQARGKQLVDIRGDLYALGCTAYFLLTARAPFPEGSVPEKMYKHVHDTPADPREYQPNLPDGLIVLLGKLLEKRPEDRYQTPAELLVDLERLHVELKASDRSASTAPAAQPPPAETRPAPKPSSSSGSTPLEGRAPPPLPDVQPRWSMVAEHVTNALVWVSTPWALAVALGMLLVAVIVLLMLWVL